MSLATIEAMDRSAARKAATEKRQPFVIFSADTAEQDLRHAPYLGSYCPRGWRRATPDDVGLSHEEYGVYAGSGREVLLFVSKDGHGGGGGDLGLMEAGDKLRTALAFAGKLGLTLGVGLCLEGQFQVHVQLYVQGRRKRARHLHAVS